MAKIENSVIEESPLIFDSKESNAAQIVQNKSMVASEKI